MWEDFTSTPCCLQKKTGSSTVGFNNFDEMLHPVTECVELCQLEVTVAHHQIIVFVFAVRGTIRGCTRCHTSFMYEIMLGTVNWRCHQRQLFTHSISEMYSILIQFNIGSKE